MSVDGEFHSVGKVRERIVRGFNGVEMDEKKKKGQLVSFVWNAGLRDSEVLGNRVKMSSGRHSVTLEGWFRNLNPFSV